MSKPFLLLIHLKIKIIRKRKVNIVKSHQNWSWIWRLKKYKRVRVYVCDCFCSLCWVNKNEKTFKKRPNDSIIYVNVSMNKNSVDSLRLLSPYRKQGKKNTLNGREKPHTMVLKNLFLKSLRDFHTL